MDATNDSNPFDFRRLTIQCEFDDVDPEVLDILTGGAFVKNGVQAQQTFSFEVLTPIKRTFWQWLRRKPRPVRRIYIPNAKIERQ